MTTEFSANATASTEAVDRPALLPQGLEKVDVIGLLKNLSAPKIAAVVVAIGLTNYFLQSARQQNISSSAYACYENGVNEAFFAVGINRPYIEIADGKDGVPEISAKAIGGAGIAWARQFSHYTLSPQAGVSAGTFGVKNWNPRPRAPAMEAVATFAQAGEIAVKGSPKLQDNAAGKAARFRERLRDAFASCAGTSRQTTEQLWELGLVRVDRYMDAMLPRPR